MDNYTLSLQAKLNISDIKQQLESVSKSTTMTIDVKVNNARLNVQKLNDSIDDTSTALKTASKQADTLGNRLQAAGRKLQSISNIISGIKSLGLMAYQALNPLWEFDEALTEFKKVSDVSGDALTEYTNKLGQMGEEVARTKTEMVAASTEFVKSGFSEEESATLARVTALFQNIADSEIEAGDAASFIISQLKAFNYTADQAESVIDAINEVSNNFAVSSTDISTGLSKTSSAMAVLGNDFNQTIGLITAGTEIMTGQAKLYWSV